MKKFILFLTAAALTVSCFAATFSGAEEALTVDATAYSSDDALIFDANLYDWFLCNDCGEIDTNDEEYPVVTMPDQDECTDPIWLGTTIPEDEQFLSDDYPYATLIMKTFKKSRAYAFNLAAYQGEDNTRLTEGDLQLRCNAKRTCAKLDLEMGNIIANPTFAIWGSCEGFTVYSLAFFKTEEARAAYIEEATAAAANDVEEETPEITAAPTDSATIAPEVATAQPTIAPVATAEPEKSGCGSVIGGSAAVIGAMAMAVVALKKKH